MARRLSERTYIIVRPAFGSSISYEESGGVVPPPSVQVLLSVAVFRLLSQVSSVNRAKSVCQEKSGNAIYLASLNFLFFPAKLWTRTIAYLLVLLLDRNDWSGGPPET